LSGNLTDEYVFFDGERVARRDGATGTGGVFYYFSDNLKTASIITDSAGTIKAESDYYSWGGELQFTNNDSNDYKFTGKKRDTETALDYFGARYYSNGLGRWVSADWNATAAPAPYADLNNPQSLNLYAYPSNPETHSDPDGHCDWCQSLTNFVSFNGWNTDVELKQKQQEYDQSVRSWLVNQYGLNPQDVAKLTPKQADKLSDALDAGKGGVTVDGVKIVVQAVAQAAAVVPTMLGANGTQVTSKTLWNGEKGRIDVENPNPGQRPGQIHYQDGSGKYIYDVAKGEFQGLSKTQNGQLLSRPEVQQAIQKGLKYLRVGQ
jgi:RHS repeat-associated protein